MHRRLVSRMLRDMASEYLSTGRGPVAIEILEVYLRNEPQDSDVWLLFGDLLLRVGRAIESVEAFERSLEGRSDEPAFLFARLALAHAESGRHAVAERYFERATTGDGVEAWIWEEWAKSLRLSGRLAEAQDRIERALKAEGCSAVTWVLLGDIMVARREYRRAKEAYSRATKLEGSCEAAESRLASLSGIEEALKSISEIP